MSRPCRFFEALNGPSKPRLPKQAPGPTCLQPAADTDEETARPLANGLAIQEIRLGGTPATGNADDARAQAESERHAHNHAQARAHAKPQAKASGRMQGDASRSTLSDGEPFVQFFDAGYADRYVKFLERSRFDEGPERRYSSALDFYATGGSWQSGSNFPVNLCEFVAYKSALAYCRPAAIKANLLKEHPTGIRDFAFFQNSGDFGDTQAYGFVLNRTAYLVFRGTEPLSLSDWTTDFDYELTNAFEKPRSKIHMAMIGALEPGRHAGFALAYGSVRPDIEAWLLARLDGPRSSADQVVFAGHSLGGALAILAAFDVASRLGRAGEVGAVVTFGAPMVGNEDFQRAYDTEHGLKDRTLRLAASLDLITQLTMAPQNYRHVGRLWHLDKRPARSWWRMYLFSALWAPEDEAARKADKKRAKLERKSATAARQRAGKPEAGQTWTLKGLLIQLLFRLAWFLVKLVRRAVAAHSVTSNYALYLSVLSYQRLRRQFPTDYDRAYFRLHDHLHYVRGTNGRIFGAARNGPMKVANPNDEIRLARQFTHFIV